MCDYWPAAARSGEGRQGGDRRNVVRNPRGGILREDFRLSDWEVNKKRLELHRISMHHEENRGDFWKPDVWARQQNLYDHSGTVEGKMTIKVRGKLRSEYGTFTPTMIFRVAMARLLRWANCST